MVENVTSAASALAVAGGPPLKSQTRAVQDIKPNMEPSEMTPRVEALEAAMRAAGMLPGGPAGAPAAEPAGAVPTRGKR
jgi:hypothetical protein